MKSTLTVLLVCFSFSVATASPPEQTAALTHAVDQLLKAYSSKNPDEFLALTDPDEILVLGTDISEVADSKAEVRELIAADFKLWGSAEFGQRAFTSIRASDHLSSVAFDVPLAMHRADGKTDTMTIRFLTVWKRNGSRWLLTQSLNSVPSVVHSATEILTSTGQK